MKITKHGQSCLFIETMGKKILIDPGSFAFGKECEGLKAADYLDTDIIVVTHEHKDHLYLPAILEIIKGGKARVIATRAVISELEKYVLDIVADVLEDGYSKTYDNIVYSGFSSKHGPLPAGAVPPEVCGIVVYDGEARTYAPGDTTEFNGGVSDVDVAFTPICGEVVMNIGEAKQELLKLKPSIAVPYHYDNPRYPVEASDFPIAMKDTGIEVKILGNGEAFEV